jgi:hypothetical protein
MWGLDDDAKPPPIALDPRQAVRDRERRHRHSDRVRSVGPRLRVARAAPLPLEGDSSRSSLDAQVADLASQIANP